MRFIRTENLAKGMRLAKPIYNKNGVLLYDRDTKLTKQGINSIKNFEIIGIYILEPAEPLPPMTDEDLEFERFQTMSVFGLKEDISLLLTDHKPINLDNLVKIITKNYCKKDKKINFMQTIRSTDDYIYKHSLGTSILAAMMGIRLGMSAMDIGNLVYASLIHDIGLLMKDSEPQTDINTTTPFELKQKKQQHGISYISNMSFIPQGVKDILSDKLRISVNPKLAIANGSGTTAAKVLYIAETYDDMTAMKLDEEPTSDVVAVRTLLNNADKYDSRTVGALVDSIKILYPGVCVELTDGRTGLVIKINEGNVLRPFVLTFTDNKLINLYDDNVFFRLQIKDIMKSMDKRVFIDRTTIDEYIKMYT